MTRGDSVERMLPLGDVGATGYPEFIAGVGALAMGSTTYEWMLRNSEQVVAEVGSAWPYSQPTWVFTSRTLPRIEGADLRFVRKNVRAVSPEMRETAGGKNPWVVGAGDLAGQFHDAGPVDGAIVEAGFGRS